MTTSSALPRILIVDDERNMCDLIETDLRLRGIQSRWCTSGAAAIEMLHQHDFDVVLTDIRMPATTGLQLCQQLTQLRPDIPVIVMTAFGTLETAIVAM